MVITMAISKYYNEQDEKRHGGRLKWYSQLVIPIRDYGDDTVLTDEELFSRLQIHYDFHSKTFDLSLEEDREYYEFVQDRAVNGWFQIQFCERMKDETGKIRYIYLEWLQAYGDVRPHNTALSLIQTVRERVEEPPSSSQELPPY